jgi:HAD superfamily hydrolase (TIGR01484 family)
MIFFSDFDGTLTKEGCGLTRDFFEILDILKAKNHELIIVSGRSLSWGHFFLTHFQLNACIMEGGGVILYLNEHGEIIEQPLIEDAEIKRLENFTTILSHHYPHIPLSKDSFGRLTDRAIEFKQMDPKWIDEVMMFMDQHDVNYAKSNVHINFWCGEISKYIGVKQYLTKFHPTMSEKDCWFFGDAPNDQSMFEFFHNCVGVSNIKHCLDRLSFKPRIILEGEENAGPLGVLNYIKSIC